MERGNKNSRAKRPTTTTTASKEAAATAAAGKALTSPVAKASQGKTGKKKIKNKRNKSNNTADAGHHRHTYSRRFSHFLGPTCEVATTHLLPAPPTSLAPRRLRPMQQQSSIYQGISRLVVGRRREKGGGPWGMGSGGTIVHHPLTRDFQRGSGRGVTLGTRAEQQSRTGREAGLSVWQQGQEGSVEWRKPRGGWSVGGVCRGSGTLRRAGTETRWIGTK